MSSQSKNKKIAKNTLLLYFRMILMMVVSLYTSRVILKQLGIEDFGLYNLIAGVVVLFSFLSNAMVTATQRFLSVELGKDNLKGVQIVFSASLVSHLFLIVLVLLAAETLGLWFINSQLDIPLYRMDAANVIYQLAILTTCLSIIRIPYNASIVANERMSFFAYISIIEAFMKLFIVWALAFFSLDKLILYSVLLMIVTIVINLAYYYYCITRLKSNRFILKYDKQIVREMTTFSGWNLFGGIADVGYKQGTNILLNIFFGVTVNAALGVTNQVRSAVFSFVGNLQMAANPQIIKSYATNNFQSFEQLIIQISKYSYYLMLLMILPIIINTELILQLWLGNPPQYTLELVILSLVFCLLDSLTGPQWVAMQAYGKLKRYQIVVSILLLCNLPVSYLFLYIGYSPACVIVIQIVITAITLIIRLLFSRYSLKLSIRKYFLQVLFPILSVSLVSALLPLYIYVESEGFYRLLYSLFTIPYMCLCIYLLGISSTERKSVCVFIRNKFLR